MPFFYCLQCVFLERFNKHSLVQLNVNSNENILITVPGIPTNVTYTTTHESVDIHWEDPLERNGIITGYTIQLTYQKQICREKGDVVNETYDVLIMPFNRYTLNNLSSYWNYNFTITATNNVGPGSSTETFTLRTNASCAYIR